MEEKLEIVCRTCLANQGEFNNIFKPLTYFKLIDTNIAKILMSFTTLEINSDDNLPVNVCKKCTDTIISMYKFKLMCEKSDILHRTNLLKLEKEERNTYFSGKNCKTEQTDSNDVNSEIESDQCDFMNKVDKTLHQIKQEITESDSSEQEKLFSSPFLNLLNKSVICEDCGKEFRNKSLLLKHKRNKNDKCVNKNKNNLTTDDNNIDLKCAICNEIFSKKEQLNDHTILKHIIKKGNSLIECHICHKEVGKTFQEISKHLKTHATIKPYVCDECGKSFCRADQLQNHNNSHSGIKPHVCNLCEKGFNQLSNLKDHMRTHNGEKPFLCSVCGKGFNQMGNLKQHTIRHSGIKSHLCSICGNGFASKGELGAHMRKHTGAKPFVCNICNNGFTTSSSLTKHKRIHSGEKPYECDTCKMRFARSGILTRHKRTHTGEKPHKCKFCTKAFTQSNDLAAHVRIHTGEKPFVCEICGQPFRQKSALKTHKKTHSPKINYQYPNNCDVNN